MELQNLVNNPYSDKSQTIALLPLWASVLAASIAQDGASFI